MSETTRRDLLLEEKEKIPISRDKLERDLDVGTSLASMMSMRGWKLLYEGFIVPNIEDSRFLGATREDLADIRAEIRILRQMMKFIETRIDSANKAAEKIKT